MRSSDASFSNSFLQTSAHLPFATPAVSPVSGLGGLRPLIVMFREQQSGRGHSTLLDVCSAITCWLNGRHILRPHRQPSQPESPNPKHLTQFCSCWCSDGWNGTLASPWVLMPNTTRIYLAISSLIVRKEWTLFWTTLKRKSMKT